MRSVFTAAWLLAAGVATAAAQSPAADWLWAAQTGPNLVTLTWQAVPGATEYQIYLGDPSAPGTFLSRPASRLGANARRANLTGMARLTNGIKLVAVDAGNGVLKEAEFNAVTPATSFAAPTPPARVTAQATGPSEITVTWDPVPGATGYSIGRAVPPGGLTMRCALCPTDPRFVDQDVSPGLPHKYTVSAIFPSGRVSARVMSGAVTPGAPQVAATPAYTPPAQPGAVTATPTPGYPPPGYTPPGQPVGGMPPTTTPTAGCATAGMPPSTTSSGSVAGNVVATVQNVVTSAARAVGAAASQVTGTTVHQATPVADTTSAQAPMTGPQPGSLLGALGRNTVASAVLAAPTCVLATVAGPAAVTLTWQPPAAPGLTGYILYRSLNGGRLQEVNKISATTQSYADAFFPSTLFATGAVRVKYTVMAAVSGTMKSAISNEVIVQPPAAGTPAQGGGRVVASCRLDYQRADNMWAAFGNPTGQLGSETISLSPGQTKAFITDWKYEKQRNDGTNYFGSHLRTATNATSSTIRLHLRSLTLSGIQVWYRTGSDTFWIRLDPNTGKQFQADLLEVFCEN